MSQRELRECQWGAVVVKSFIITELRSVKQKTLVFRDWMRVESKRFLWWFFRSLSTSVSHEDCLCVQKSKGRRSESTVSPSPLLSVSASLHSKKRFQKTSNDREVSKWWKRSHTSSGLLMMFTLTTCSDRTDSEWIRFRRLFSSTFWDKA